MRLEEQTQGELAPYVDQLQRDLQTVYEIDLQYNRKWAEAAAGAYFESWDATYDAMGCTSEKRHCQDMLWFLDHIDHAVDKCKCTNFPIQISNSNEMKCAIMDNGDVACVNI